MLLIIINNIVINIIVINVINNYTNAASVYLYYSGQIRTYVIKVKRE